MHYDCINFISYASYSNSLGNRSIFDQKFKIPLALNIKNWGFQLKKAGRGSRDKKMQENLENLTVDHGRWPLTRRSTGWGTGRPVRRGWEFKRPLRVSFFHCSPPFLEDSSSSRLQRPVWAIPWTDFRLWSDFLHDFEARVSSLDGFGLRIWTGSSLIARHLLVLLLSRAPRASWS